MGPLLVGAAGLMRGRAAVAGPGPGGGLGALRLPPWGLRSAAGSCGAVASAACGDCGAVTAAAARSRLLPRGTLGLRGLSAQFAVLCCGVLKGAAGGHDDVCFAFGRNLACR